MFQLRPFMTVVFVVLLCLFAGLAHAKEESISRQELYIRIHDWIDPELLKEILTIHMGDLTPISLVNGEKAYLVGAMFNRGRLDMLGSLLIRPAVRGVRDVKLKSYEVYDFDENGVSEIVDVWLDTGGGSEYRRGWIIQFDGWEVEILREARYEHHTNQDPDRIMDHNYKHFDWIFFKKQGKTYLKEFNESKVDSKISNSTTLLLFVKDKFIEVKDTSVANEPGEFATPKEDVLPVKEDKKIEYAPGLDTLVKAYTETKQKPLIPNSAMRSLHEASRTAQNKQFHLEYALHRCNEELQRTPWWPQLWYNKALFNGELRRYGPAIQNMEQYLAFKPDAEGERNATQYIASWKDSLRRMPLEDMVVIQAGEFLMGTAGCEENNCRSQTPQHRVRVPAFELGRHVITCEQWNACVFDGGCKELKNCGYQGIQFSRIEDSLPYVVWLNAKTGKTYRLPTEAEWEYAARAGTTTHYPWGDKLDAKYLDTEYMDWVGTDRIKRIGSYPPNAFSLYDMLGYVWQLTGDCYVDNYNGAPNDGSARVTDRCEEQVIRGGEAGIGIWDKNPTARSSFQKSNTTSRTYALRLARSLP